MAGSFEGLQAHTAELDYAAVGERREAVFGLGFSAKINRGARAVSEFQMSGNKIGVKMSQKDVLDLQAVFSGKGEILADVTLRIDNSGGPRRLVANEVRSVSQTV